MVSVLCVRDCFQPTSRVAFLYHIALGGMILLYLF